MPLTDSAVRNAKPADKPRRLFDERGLYLEVSPSGGKWWRFKYRYEGKEKRLSFGVYPDVMLRDARERRDAARKLLANNVDPGEERKAQKQAKVERETGSFEVIAREWHAKQKAGWTDDHAERIMRRLELNLFPYLGGKQIREITPPELLKALTKVEERGAHETAHRCKSICSMIYRYGVATGRADRDITVDLRGALAPVRVEHFAATTDPKRVAEMLRIIDGYVGSTVVRAALKLAPLVFVRPGELRHAKWKDVDLSAAQWAYRVGKTKTDHIVPLAPQAVEILRELHPITGAGEFVFPGARGNDRPLSDNTLNAALRRLGIGPEEMTSHGLRAVARTLLDEVLGFPPHLIEHQLAHTVRDPLGRAYNRTAHLAQRREMMKAWARYLEQLKAGRTK